MLDEIDCMAGSRRYSDGGASAEVSRSTTCLLQLLDEVSNDHVILAATNLIEDVDQAVKRRFTEKHEMKRLSDDENYDFICQYMDSTGFEYNKLSAMEYGKQKKLQAEIMTHMTRKIAQALIKKENTVCF